MKIFKSFKSGVSLTAKVREVMLTILPLLHVTLVIAPVYTFLACVAYVDSGISSVQYFFSSLLLIIPATITKYASMYIKQLWLFLVVCIVMTVSAWFITTCPIVILICIIMSVLRLVARVRQDASVFDRPHYVALLVFIIPFYYGGLNNDWFIQLMALILAFVYMSIVFAYNGFKKIEDYIQLNNTMAEFPERRIGKSMATIFGVGALIFLSVSLVCVMSSYEFFGIVIPQIEVSEEEKALLVESTADPYASYQQMADLFGEATHNPVMAAVDQTATIISVILMIGLFIFLIVELFLIFSKTVKKEKADIIESTAEPELKEVQVEKKEKLKMLDMSPNAVIRRKYKKTIKSKLTPEEWMTPAEMEKRGKFSIDLLHNLYEKARYSENGCTQADKEAVK
ncbi:MAG: hypothetical protein E7564_10580 [Ruminococcaceae bacterium]|nr:hypothetical protein [Oscillospiraceae bacterium]